MKKYSLIPDLMLKDIYEITPEFLHQKRIRGVMFDLDNTLAPYDAETPNRKLSEYLKSLCSSGIIIGIISNNNKERVELFSESIGCFTAYNAKKPLPKDIKLFLAEHQLKDEEVFFVGDQIFTDCFAAHLAGVASVIVEPLKKDTGFFFKFKRFLERPFMNAYYRRNN